MKKAQNGDNVRLHFAVYDGDGIKLATTFEEEPMELTIGDRKLIECFEQSVVGMVEGEKKSVRLNPAEAMGERKPELVTVFPREVIPEQHEKLKVGSKVEVKDDNGNPLIGRVAKLTDQEVTVDSNHPLAGKALVFDIELVEFM